MKTTGNSAGARVALFSKPLALLRVIRFLLAVLNSAAVLLIDLLAVLAVLIHLFFSPIAASVWETNLFFCF